MKRKITYLIKDFDSMTKTILAHLSSLDKQVELIKNKKNIFDEIDKMIVKYDKIITEIQQESAEEYEV